MSRARAEMDAEVAPDATPWSPQIRLLGVLLTFFGFILLIITSIWSTVFPLESNAANTTLGIGLGSALFCFVIGALSFYKAPYTSQQTILIIGAAGLGLTACILVEWFALLIPGLFYSPLPMPSAIMYSAMGPIVGNAVTVGVAPFEEYLCILIQYLGMQSSFKYGPVIGIMGQAAIFAALHLRAYLLSIAILIMFLVGIIKGVSFYYAPYAEVPIIIHMGLNSLSLGVMPQ